MEAGHTLLHYRLVEKIGEGGMGVVWKAVDTTLDREVALKVLPEGFGADSERAARFEREAKLLASLNHPNIASLYGLHEAEGVRFLTMELVEGEDLSSRLVSGAVPPAEACELSRQVAEALEAAHQSGVVHRDLKPANVMIGPGGRVKVLDFGLAKAFETAATAASRDHSLSPTLTSAGTVAGVILGTAAYMSPEQARGHAVDSRSDVWSFGCLLWETLTGRRLFRGETVSDTLAAVLRADPEWDELPAGTPSRVRELLGRCLERDRRSRLQAVGEARIALERVLADPGEDERKAAAAAPLPRARASRLPWVLVAVLALLAIAFSFAPCLWGEGGTGKRIRTIVLPPGAVEFAHTQEHSGSLTVSPDGRYLTFAEAEIGRPGRLWLRPLDGSPARPLPGTEGGSFPFWSADSRHIAFFANGKLRRIDLQGSPPVALCDAPNGRSGGWNEAGDIIFSPAQNRPVHRVAAGGGVPEPVTELDEEAGESTHRWATFLPDGQGFLYMAGGHAALPQDEVHAIWAGRLGSKERTRILTARSNPVYADGHLLFVRDRVLLAQPFDPRMLELTGDPFPISDGVVYDMAYFRGAFAAAGEVLVHARGEAVTDRELHWIDMETGALDEEVLGEPARIHTAELSPDDRYAALVVEEPETARNDLWIQDLERGTRTRFTFDPRDEYAPMWSPDSRSVAYAAVEGETGGLYLKTVTGEGAERLLLEMDRRAILTDWTDDGRYLVAEVDADDDPATNDDDILALPLDGGEPITVVSGPAHETGGDVSPNGRWIAYTSVESGRPEAFVTAFPGPGRKYQVSAGGAFGAAWESDGRAVIALTPDLTVLRVPVVEREGALEIGRPVAVFRDPRVVDGDVSHRGGRALVVIDPAQKESIPLTLDLNWAERREGR